MVSGTSLPCSRRDVTWRWQEKCHTTALDLTIEGWIGRGHFHVLMSLFILVANTVSWKHGNVAGQVIIARSSCGDHHVYILLPCLYTKCTCHLVTSAICYMFGWPFRLHFYCCSILCSLINTSVTTCGGRPRCEICCNKTAGDCDTCVADLTWLSTFGIA